VPTSLFVYGELCKPPVLRQVLGRVPPSEPAVLGGFSRRMTPETGCFRAVAQAGAMIVGLLLEGIEPSDIAKLDAFENTEDGEYERLSLQVKTVLSAREVSAWAYVGAESGAAATHGGP